MERFFTSDLHFNHKNVLVHAERPFKAIDEMNAALITNWNNTVSKSDIVYFLGDFGWFRKTEEAQKVIDQLNGQKHFIFGNHDDRRIRRTEGWASKNYYKRIKINKRKVILCHYPLLTWDGAHRGSIMLHGHSHGNLAPTTQPRIDVGVDCWNFTPVSFEQILEEIKDRKYDPVDHHQ